MDRDAHEWVVLVLIQRYNNFGRESLEYGCFNSLEFFAPPICWPCQNQVETVQQLWQNEVGFWDTAVELHTNAVYVKSKQTRKRTQSDKIVIVIILVDITVSFQYCPCLKMGGGGGGVQKKNLRHAGKYFFLV